RKQVGVLLPDSLRLEVFEVLHQPGAVEPAIAEIGCQVRQPGAAEKTAGYASRVDAGFSGPVGQRRPVEYGRTGKPLAIGGKNGDGPTGLAIAIKNWRVALMAFGNLFHKAAEDVKHVGHGLARRRFGKEDHEIDRVALVHGDPDFGLALEAADARAVSG